MRSSVLLALASIAAAHSATATTSDMRHVYSTAGGYMLDSYRSIGVPIAHGGPQPAQLAALAARRRRSAQTHPGKRRRGGVR
jgi:hypothetical protein